MIHSWDNPPPISLSFILAYVVPRCCIYALTSIVTTIDTSSNAQRMAANNLIQIGHWINYWVNNPHSILILLLFSVNLIVIQRLHLIGHLLNFNKFHLYIENILYISSIPVVKS